MSPRPEDCPVPGQPCPADSPSEVERKVPEWTDSERSELRQQMVERRHRIWLIGVIKRVAQLIAATLLAITVLWDWLVKIIKAAGGGP